MYIIGLMLAGESIYLLPYLRKTFQTSMEQVFQISGIEVGWLNTVFGILAVASYFPSGWLADRISARRLLTFSLLSTSAGGFFMFSIPSYPQLLVLHALWGITSILTFWAALIKATRIWGDSGNQGISFGLLDGGRGVVAALVASLATTAYALAGTVEESLRNVLLIYSLAPLLAGVLIWFVIPDQQYQGNRIGKQPGKRTRRGDVKAALRMPQVWLIALIIFCAYVLYVGAFDFPAFAERTYGRSKTFGALLGTMRDWMRPVAAVTAGFLADRFSTNRILRASFLLLILGFFSMGLLKPATGQIWILWVQVIICALAGFSLRGIYFALLEETRIPGYLTGITVGFVSFLGFTPDIFLHAMSGWFVEHFPDTTGYRYYFLIMSVVALAGWFATYRIRRYAHKEYLD